MAYNNVAYVWNMGGPGELQRYIADIQGSGLTTVILFGLHIGRKLDALPAMKLGDLMYNDFAADPANGILRGNLLVSDGKFNPTNDPAIAAWPAQLAQLKQRSNVSKVFMSIGGASQWVYDFRTIESMLSQPASAALLKKNFQALKEALTVGGACVLDGFDIDNEEFVSADTIVWTCEMLFALGFDITFCPYQDQDTWQGYMQTLWDKGLKVSWWNLQCYAGGSGNRTNLAPWLTALGQVVGAENAPGYLVPGLAVKSADDVFPVSDRLCPDQVESAVAGWNNSALAGVFFWRYDALTLSNSGRCGGTNSLAHYLHAVEQGMKKA